MTGHILIVVSLLFAAALRASASDSVASEGDIEAGKAIYDSYCAALCHQAPAAGRLKPKQWRVVLNTMQTRMQSAGMEPLSEVELRQVLAYLSQGK